MTHENNPWKMNTIQVLANFLKLWNPYFHDPEVITWTTSQANQVLHCTVLFNTTYGINKNKSILDLTVLDSEKS